MSNYFPFSLNHSNLCQQNDSFSLFAQLCPIEFRPATLTTMHAVPKVVTHLNTDLGRFCLTVNKREAMLSLLLSLSLCLSQTSSLFFFPSLSYSLILSIPSLPISLYSPSNLSHNLSSIRYSLLFHMTPVFSIIFSIFSPLFSPFSLPPSSPTFLFHF